MSLLFDWTFSSMYIIKLSTYKHFNLNIQKINNLTNLRTYCSLLNVFSYRFVNQWESNTIEHQGEQSRYQSINRSIQLYTIEVKCEFKMRRRLLLQSDTTFYRRLCSTGDRIYCFCLRNCLCGGSLKLWYLVNSSNIKLIAHWSSL